MDGTLYDLASTEEFMNAWKALTGAPMTFDAFARLPMPQGCTAEELWRTFAILRRLEGVTFSVKPWFHSVGDVSWASMTRQTERELLDIASLASPGSRLNTSVETPQVRMALTSFIVDELCPTCHFDGIQIQKDALESLWKSQRQPSNDEERLIANLVSIFENAHAYAARPFSLAMLERVREDLVQDLDVRPDTPHSGSLASNIDWDERLRDPEFAEQMLLDALRDAREVRSLTDAVVAFHEISCALWDLSYYPNLRSLTELAFRRVYFTKLGMPVLSFVPFRYLAGRKGHRFDRLFVNESEHLQSVVGSEYGLDCTIMLSGTVSVLLDGLTAVSQRVAEIRERIETDERELESATGLNRRQKDFLAIARHDPAMRMRVKGYASLFNVVRATARADLLDLVERGYLTVAMENRAAVFSLPDSAGADR